MLTIGPVSSKDDVFHTVEPSCSGCVNTLHGAATPRSCGLDATHACVLSATVLTSAACVFPPFFLLHTPHIHTQGIDPSSQVTGALLDEYGNSQVDYDDVDEDELIGEWSNQPASCCSTLSVGVTPTCACWSHCTLLTLF